MNPNFPSCQAAHFFIGLDLGQVRDPSAIAVLEHLPYPDGRSPVTYQWNIRIRRSIRYLQRLPLHIGYPEIVDRVSALVRRPEFNRNVTLVVDATGVGRPVVDLLRRQALPCRIMPVTITSGGAGSSENGYTNVPKPDLMAGLVLLFQTRQIAISGQLPETKTLLHELGNMRVKVSPQGRESYGVWKHGEHDDLVLALALACWRGIQVHPPK